MQQHHRKYVGGMWDEIGQLQFRYLTPKISPSDVVLDIGCGSLRFGVLLIPWLERGHYIGIEANYGILKAGIHLELGQKMLADKAPRLLVDDSFNFSLVDEPLPTVSWAHSLFTHLNAADIKRCLSNLASITSEGHVLYATWFYGDSSNNLERSNPHAGFRYSRAEMEKMAHGAGWFTEVDNHFRHPRGQQMMVFTRSIDVQKDA